MNTDEQFELRMSESRQLRLEMQATMSALQIKMADFREMRIQSRIILDEIYKDRHAAEEANLSIRK